MSDLGEDLAADLADWLSDDSPMPAPPGTVYFALFDSTDTEVTGDFENGRVGLDNPTELDRTNTAVENAAEINFGEATANVDTVENVALLDSDTGGDMLAYGEIDDAPFDVSSGVTLFFDPGELTLDFVDRTQ